MRPAEALDALELLLDEGQAVAAVMRLDANRWVTDEPGSAALLGALVAGSALQFTAESSILERLLEVPIGVRRRMVLEDAVSAELALVVRIDAARVDRHRPFKAMGVDSLMALELRNRLESQTGLQLSATIVWNYPTVAVLSEYLAGRMHVDLDGDMTHPDDVAPADEAVGVASRPSSRRC